MNSTLPPIGLYLGLMMAVWLSAAARAESARHIRLRGELIATPDPVRPRAGQLAGAAADTASGLFLVQFTAPVQPEWRVDLARQGVLLLRYVPDDAFVASVAGASLSEVRALTYVRWVGEYEPRHKLDPGLAERLATPATTPAGSLSVKLVTSPHAPRGQIDLLAKSFQRLTYRRASSLGTVLGGDVSAVRLAALAHSSLVLWIEPSRHMKLLDEVASKIVGGDDLIPGTPTVVHQLGYDGSGVTVAVADSGLDSGDPETLHPDLKGRVDAFLAYGGLPDASDEHSHGTHCAGIVGGNAATGAVDENGYQYGLGIAPGAHLVAQRLFDGIGNYYAPSSYEQLTHDAVRNGAVVGSNSWGDEVQGRYNLDAAEFDALVRDADAFTPGEQPYFLEFSAGNSGPGAYTINTPAVAKNVLATGACQNNRFEFPIYAEGQEVTADFSSRGPCDDGRIKPDVMAPGTWIASLKSQYATDDNAWAAIDQYYLYQGGTSQAGPHAAGAAAVFIQYYRATHADATPSPALVKAALINSATDMDVAYVPDDEGDLREVGDTGPVPNNDEGWGRVDLANLIASDRRFSFTEQGIGLQTAQTFEKRVVVSPNDALKVTLVYTDVPGLPASIPALVNDLDLEVVGPDGQLYRGNAFLDGEGVPGTPAGDRVNNVEGVHLGAPLPGEYLVRVRAVRVVEDVHGRRNPAPEQDFALVVSGDLPTAGEGMVFFNRGVYPAPAVAQVRLIDQQLAGQPRVAVTVTSATDPAGETLELLANGSGGSFTNSLALVTAATPPGDGRLQVAHGDTIVAHYRDASPPADLTGEAGIDLVPPTLTGVIPLNRYGRTTILWQSDEPATSLVVFGPPDGTLQSVAIAGYTEAHRIELPPMEAGVTNRFYVVSSDPAGNTTTNDNQGRWFTFVSTEAASALLLYSPEAGWNDLLGDFLGEYPGIENWTTPLDQLGVSYETWDLGERVPPTAADLAPFRVVLWRPEEIFGDAPTDVTAALTSYVNQGGSLLVCSYDLLSRLDEAGLGAFSTNVLHVAGFQVDQGVTSIGGDPGDPVGGGLRFDLDYTAFPPDAWQIGIDWPDGVDTLQPTADAMACFRDAIEGGPGATVGVRYPKTGADSTYRVVFCAFAFEAIPLDVPAPDDRVTFLANALDFLVPGLSGKARVAFDRPAYTVPGAVVVEVSDANRAGQKQATVALQSASEPSIQTLTLQETVRPGIFRGAAVLVAADASPAPGQVRAQHGDLLQANYVDAVQLTAETAAIVDTHAPAIASVAADPAYNEAVITWETDKPTDALVQFNDAEFSFPVNRTAYDASLATSHSVLVAGLLPDRQYFYQVQSRDQAGNVANSGPSDQFFTFRTLQPLPPPWTDDLEHGRAGWAVYNDEQAVDDETGQNLLDSGWQLGVPENAEGLAARSGAQCWATNLKGQDVSLAISDLVSPAVDLTNGRKATLRFWHYYDFTERSEFLDIELGQLAISTDNGATWAALYAVDGDFSLGWEEVEIDISRFTGHVVRFLWNYQMFSFDPTPRTGWLIDDVSVSLDTTPTGVITVTNNLVQASFLLTGPITNYAAGLTYQITNAPVGTYLIRWEPVEFYTTPPAQTNTLAAGAPLAFVGNYTFPDANHNGISDLYEQAFFGAVAQPHPPETDSDRDDVSDGDEFIAGTNPTDPASRLAITAVNLRPNRTVRVEWLAVPGHAYQLQLSTNLVDWVPASEWVRTEGFIAFAALPPLTGSTQYWFRLQVRP